MRRAPDLRRSWLLWACVPAFAGCGGGAAGDASAACPKLVAEVPIPNAWHLSAEGERVAVSSFTHGLAVLSRGEPGVTATGFIELPWANAAALVPEAGLALIADVTALKAAPLDPPAAAREVAADLFGALWITRAGPRTVVVGDGRQLVLLELGQGGALTRTAQVRAGGRVNGLWPSRSQVTRGPVTFSGFTYFSLELNGQPQTWTNPAGTIDVFLPEEHALWALDLSEPRSPVVLGGAPVGGVAAALALSELDPDALFVAVDQGTLDTAAWRIQTLDVSQPQAPRARGEGAALEGRPFSLATIGARLIAGQQDGTLRIFDVADPWSPEPLCTIQTGSEVHTILPVGPDRIGVASWNNGYREYQL